MTLDGDISLSRRRLRWPASLLRVMARDEHSRLRARLSTGAVLTGSIQYRADGELIVRRERRCAAKYLLHYFMILSAGVVSIGDGLAGR